MEKENKKIYSFIITDFEYTLLEKFLQFCEEHQNDNVIFYLKSNGGDLRIQEAMNYYIDMYFGTPEGNSANLIVDYAASAAMNFFLDFKGNIKMLESAEGLIHKTSRDVTIKFGTQNNEYFQQQLYNATKETPSRDYEFLTKEERRIFDGGNDLFVSSKRMQEILKWKIENDNKNKHP